MQVARSGRAFSASGFREMNFLPYAAVATVFCCINFQLKSRARTHPGTLPVLYSACTSSAPLRHSSSTIHTSSRQAR